MSRGWMLLILPVILAASSWAGHPSASPLPSLSPKIQPLLKPAVYDRVVKDREVMTHAKIDGPSYSYYAAMLVRSPVDQTRSVLTNYELYSKLISYVETTRYNPETHILEMRGSFMGWGLHSWILFEEKSDGWIHFKIVSGHFTGMTGDMYFEPYGAVGADKSSLVYMGGALTQSDWPPIPKFILEWGAEIVFGITGNRMRSYIESTKVSTPNDQNLPQPRRRL